MNSIFFLLMIRRPPRSTLDRSSAASDVYKRQAEVSFEVRGFSRDMVVMLQGFIVLFSGAMAYVMAVSYTHLRAHETVLDLVCRLLLEKKQNSDSFSSTYTRPRHPHINRQTVTLYRRQTTAISIYTT